MTDEIHCIVEEQDRFNIRIGPVPRSRVDLSTLHQDVIPGHDFWWYDPQAVTVDEATEKLRASIIKTCEAEITRLQNRIKHIKELRHVWATQRQNSSESSEAL